MLKTYKYRLYPDELQKEKIDKTIGVCRFIYNLALETKIYAWKSAQINLTAYDLINQLPELKREYNWIKDVDSQSIQASIINMENAFKLFFNGSGFPKFKRKRAIGSFQCPRNTRKVDFEKNLLTIPKIKNIPIRLSRRFSGTIKTVTISKTASGKYYASILISDTEKLPSKPEITPDSTLGIDIGIKSYAVTSDGKFYKPNRFLKNSLSRLKCLQRRVNRRQCNSNNRKKAILRVAKLHEKISSQRIDYIHKITTQLVRDNQAKCFVIEDLNVSGMLKNKKLSQAISDVSFGEFSRQMKYKCDWYGKNLLIINRFAPSSKRCSECGVINRVLTLADRDWVCDCGASHDRDLNAAKNIKWFGLSYTPVGSRGEPAESQQKLDVETGMHNNAGCQL